MLDGLTHAGLQDITHPGITHPDNPHTDIAHQCQDAWWFRFWMNIYTITTQSTIWTTVF